MPVDGTVFEPKKINKISEMFAASSIKTEMYDGYVTVKWKRRQHEQQHISTLRSSKRDTWS